MIPDFICRLFCILAPDPQVKDVVASLPPAPDAESLRAFAEAETQEMSPIDPEVLRRERAFLLAEADNFRLSPEEYWARAHR